MRSNDDFCLIAALLSAVREICGEEVTIYLTKNKREIEVHKMEEAER